MTRCIACDAAEGETRLTIVLTWTEEGVEPYGPEPRTDLGERRKVRIVRKPFAALWSYSGGERELAACRAYATKQGGDARAFYIPTGAEDWKAQALASALVQCPPARKPRALQMTAKRLAILTQYRENLEGGIRTWATCPATTCASSWQPG